MHIRATHLRRRTNGVLVELLVNEDLQKVMPHVQTISVTSNRIISFIYFPLIRTGSQNPCGYGNSHIFGNQEAAAYPGILFGGRGPTNSVEDRENGDLGAVAA